MSRIEQNDHTNIDTIRKLHRWRMAFFGVVILLAGIVIGGASMMILLPHKILTPPPGPEFDSLRMLPSLRRDLDLTTEQSIRVTPILDTYMKKLGEIRMEARADIAGILKQMNKDICEILTDRQERLWKRSLERLQRGLRPDSGGLGRRGEGAGGLRQRRGQPDSFRRGPGPYGPRQHLRGPNVPQDVTEPNSGEIDQAPPANGDS